MPGRNNLTPTLPTFPDRSYRHGLSGGRLWDVLSRVLARLVDKSARHW